MIVNVEPSAQLQYALYDEGPSLEDCDLIRISMPLSLVRKSHIVLTETARKIDKDLLDGLRRRGFKLDFGEDETGWQFKYLTRGGGYYFNVGCSDLIVKGEIGLVQFADIASFVSEGALMGTGETLAADLIILATGYKGQEHLVRKLFGDDVLAASVRFGGSATDKNCATCSREPRSQAFGSSPAASPNAASTRNISRCRSRPARWACCPEIVGVWRDERVRRLSTAKPRICAARRELPWFRFAQSG